MSVLASPAPAPVVAHLASAVPVSTGPVQRLSPNEACRAWNDGAVVLDLRTPDERRRQGELPGALDDPPGDGRLCLLVSADGSPTAGSDRAAAAGHPVLMVTGGYAAWRTQVWREWGELLAAEPGTPVPRFFRLLRADVNEDAPSVRSPTAPRSARATAPPR